MRILLTITKRFLLDLVRQRSNIIWMVIMPLIITFLFGVLPNLGSSKVAVAVIDSDHSKVSRAYVQALEHADGVQVKPILPSETTQTLRDMQASVIVTLPKGLQSDIIHGETPTIGWLKSPSASGNSSDGLNVADLQQQVTRWTQVGTASVASKRHSGDTSSTALVAAFTKGLTQGQKVHSLVQVKTDTLVSGNVHNKTLSSTASTLAGFATMFIIFIVFSSTGDIFREKQTGTWNRLKVSPAGRFQVIGGYALAYFVIGWFQFLLMRFLGAWLFRADIPLGGWTVLAVCLYILGISGIALCIAGVAKSGEQHRMIGAFLALATTMMSGAYWPLDIEPVWMQHLAWFVPQTWALQAFKLAAIGASTLTALATPMIVLAGFAVVFFTAGMVQLRYS
ncbi:ABC transporter permease [Alicyclobacillus herbarius]|uniref:ABC transporter permease n=1 Tax=Alicyclobacillus herbarius TaxID=122960 RepID=UPI00041676FF|nr:ABC transporter permease [Alicyclobacillus herbarius]